MRIIQGTGNIWEYEPDYAPTLVVVPTNMTPKRDHTIVMGAGMAKEAARRYPTLPSRLYKRYLADEMPTHQTPAQRRTVARGEIYEPDELQVFPDLAVICLPTKDNWKLPSDLKLIKKCIRQLEWHFAYNEIFANTNVLMPRIGCGLGGLDWVSQVKPLVMALTDDRLQVENSVNLVLFE